MQHPPQSDVLPLPNAPAHEARPGGDRIYQLVTIAAILMILASVWVF